MRLPTPPRPLRPPSMPRLLPRIILPHFAALAALRAPIDRFFDEVMVMDKDEQLRDNRLKLLNRFEAVFSGIANIGELRTANEVFSQATAF